MRVLHLGERVQMQGALHISLIVQFDDEPHSWEPSGPLYLPHDGREERERERERERNRGREGEGVDSWGRHILHLFQPPRAEDYGDIDDYLRAGWDLALCFCQHQTTFFPAQFG